MLRIYLALLKNQQVYNKTTNLYNKSCIDLFLTICSQTFQNSVTIETGVSDFHKMVITVLKFFYNKRGKPLSKDQNFETNIYVKERTKPKVSVVDKEISA